MGVEYGLFHNESKTFIDLGKLTINGYRMPAERIAGFMRHCVCGTFSVIADNDDEYFVTRDEGYECVDCYDEEPPDVDDTGSYIYEDNPCR